MQKTREMLSESKFYEGYSRWNEELNRYETWNEAVDRVMDMHKTFYKDKMTDELQKYIDEVTEAYKEKRVLGAQRALQFGGDQILKHNMKLYNCTSSYADRPAFFNEVFYILLAGAGAGFSIQKHHVAKLPKILERKKMAKIYKPEDSIEGWAETVAVLMSSYFEGGGVYPEYESRRIYFDLSEIRPKGAFISGGFKAPGPEPLRRSLDKIEYLIQGRILKGESYLRPIDVYDIVMYIADAVLSGGVRRSATIALFSKDDNEMMTAKTGNWFEENPQRARSNNTVVLIRNEVTKEEFSKVMENTKQFGEPGFAFFENNEITVNPCFEIGMFPQIDGESGWQGCNLTELNGSMCDTEEHFYKACRSGAILGTLQAGYTKFNYLSETTKKIFEREALLGVSITGWMNNPQILFDKKILKKGAKIVKETNKIVSELLGINQAARTTAVKPSGNASVLLGTASGIHPEHSRKYIRHVQMNKESEVAHLIKEKNPYMVEESFWSSNKSDYVISFPIITNEESILKRDMTGIKFLEKVKMVQQVWIEEGTNVELCAIPEVRHNVSNTVLVEPDQWKEVEKYIFDNKNFFAGISLLPSSGDKDYTQAPFTEVLSNNEILEKYGTAAFFASGLIVDGVKIAGDIWRAIELTKDYSGQFQEILDHQIEWIRRFEKFANNYFGGDKKMTEYCLKDVYLLHKWSKINNNLQDINFAQELQSKKYVDIDTMGSAACVGGSCEI